MRTSEIVLRTSGLKKKIVKPCCSNHFDDDSFEGGRTIPVLGARLGFCHRPKLKVNALPMQARSEVGDVYTAQFSIVEVFFILF